MILVFGLFLTTACSPPSRTKDSLVQPLPAVSEPLTDSPTLARIRQTGKIRIGVKFDLPLFGFRDPKTGSLSGFDIEIAKAISESLFPNDKNPLRRIEFVEAISKNRERLLTDAVVDIVVSTYTVTDARRQIVDFAGPYYIAGQDILARKADITSGRIRGVNDTNGKRVCSVTGSTSLANLRSAAPLANTSITKDKYSECFEALKQGQVDAMTTDDAILLGLTLGNSEFQITGNPFHTEPYGVGLPKGDAKLRLHINAVLRAMFTDGRWAKAFQRTVGTSGALVPVPPEIATD